MAARAFVVGVMRFNLLHPGYQACQGSWTTTSTGGHVSAVSPAGRPQRRGATGGGADLFDVKPGLAAIALAHGSGVTAAAAPAVTMAAAMAATAAPAAAMTAPAMVTMTTTMMAAMADDDDDDDDGHGRITTLMMMTITTTARMTTALAGPAMYRRPQR
jgi:hypothetical protein